MKKTITTLLLVVICPAIMYGQLGGLADKLTQKIKEKAKARAERKVDKVIDHTLDTMEGKRQKPGKKEVSQNQAEMSSDTAKRMYIKYDFIPGEDVIYSHDFSADNMGEMPAGWNSNGNAAVVTIKDLKGNWVQLYQNAVYLTDNKASFTENFTVEFDLVLHRSNPKAPFPEMTWGILSSGHLDPDDNSLLKDYTATFATEMSLQPSDEIRSTMQLQAYKNRGSYFKTDIQKPGELLLQFNKVVHIAMQVQKERMRIWWNGQKIYDLPKAIARDINLNQLYFTVKRYGGSEQEVGYAISNIKIAKGLPDTRHKLLNEGRFSTTGILFNVNSYTVLPESNGVISEIASILTKNPELKIKIIGHTDSDGSETANLELSKQRAAAVKQVLTDQFRVDASRMESDGAGERQPVGDNGTKEGKANNRRVEFVRQ